VDVLDTVGDGEFDIEGQSIVSVHGDVAVLVDRTIRGSIVKEVIGEEVQLLSFTSEGKDAGHYSSR
jgi:hypothetical protein